jgi:hypothetical protein
MGKRGLQAAFGGRFGGEDAKAEKNEKIRKISSTGMEVAPPYIRLVGPLKTAVVLMRLMMRCDG